MSKPYIVIDAPGYYSVSGMVYSEHISIESARRAIKRHMYTDERGQRRYPAAVAHNERPYHRGDTFYGDMTPKLVD